VVAELKNQLEEKDKKISMITEVVKSIKVEIIGKDKDLGRLKGKCK
jgi:hypothetical protein